MDVREKLVELLRNSPHFDTVKGYKSNDCTFEQGADWLIAHGVTVQEWISVTERLPEEKTNYIVYYKHAFCDDESHIGTCICYYDGVEFNMDSLHEVTHWAYLPPPPKGE